MPVEFPPLTANKPATVSTQGLETRSVSEVDLLLACLMELKRIRLGLQLLVNDPLNQIDTEDTEL